MDHGEGRFKGVRNAEMDYQASLPLMKKGTLLGF